MWETLRSEFMRVWKSNHCCKIAIVLSIFMIVIGFSNMASAGEEVNPPPLPKGVQESALVVTTAQPEKKSHAEASLFAAAYSIDNHANFERDNDPFGMMLGYVWNVGNSKYWKVGLDGYAINNDGGMDIFARYRLNKKWAFGFGVGNMGSTVTGDINAGNEVLSVQAEDRSTTTWMEIRFKMVWLRYTRVSFDYTTQATGQAGTKCARYDAPPRTNTWKRPPSTCVEFMNAYETANDNFTVTDNIWWLGGTYEF